jgi:hypothetical protein
MNPIMVVCSVHAQCARTAMANKLQLVADDKAAIGAAAMLKPSCDFEAVRASTYTSLTIMIDSRSVPFSNFLHIMSCLGFDGVIWEPGLSHEHSAEMPAVGTRDQRLST